jgi:hypothetical protein
MARAAQERRQPDFVVRAPDSSKRGRWVTLGVAWETELRDKSIGYSIKLNSIPVGEWDGTLMLLPPFAEREEDSTRQIALEEA